MLHTCFKPVFSPFDTALLQSCTSSLFDPVSSMFQPSLRPVFSPISAILDGFIRKQASFQSCLGQFQPCFDYFKRVLVDTHTCFGLVFCCYGSVSAQF